MRRPVVLLLLAACSSNPSAPAQPAKAPSPAQTDSPVAAVEDEPSEDAPPGDVKNANAFTLKMFSRAAKKDHGNVMLSGASVRQAFAIAYSAASGETAKEIAKTFGFAGDKKAASAAARAELDEWTKAKGEGAELTVANRVWVEKSMPLSPDFNEGAEGADFKSAPDQARRTVNEWVATQTKDKIKELLPEGSVGADTRAIITNAIYFKGKWVNPFAKGLTKDDAFVVDAKTKLTVPTMHVTDSFRYAHPGNVHVVELKYIGHDLSMVIVMPDDAKDLARLEEHPTLAAWTKELKPSRLDLSVPRFSFRWGGSIKEALVDLGVKTAFTTKADLSGLAGKPGDLSVSDVFHQTFVAVDEQGTEAAAATGTLVKLTSLQTGTALPVKIDHPFLFFVRGKDRILFAGRVTEPKP